MSQTFTPNRDNRGLPQLICTCDACGATEIVRARINARSRGKDVADVKPDKGAISQAVSKLTANGWTYIGKTLRCPKCEEERKMTKTTTDPKKIAADPPPEPDRKQKREIMLALEEFYDVDAGRFVGDATDASIAELTSTRPGWVAQIREEFFGPVGSNEEMERLIEEINAFRVETHELETQALKVAQDLSRLRAQGSRMLADLGKIKDAVGQHVVKKAGLDISH